MIRDELVYLSRKQEEEERKRLLEIEEEKRRVQQQIEDEKRRIKQEREERERQIEEEIRAEEEKARALYGKFYQSDDQVSTFMSHTCSIRCLFCSIMVSSTHFRILSQNFKLVYSIIQMPVRVETKSCRKEAPGRRSKVAKTTCNFIVYVFHIFIDGSIESRYLHS